LLGSDVGMVIWRFGRNETCKIFKNESQLASWIKDTIVTQIRETMQSLNLNNSKNQNTGQDLRILELFYLKEWSFNIPVARDPQIQTGVNTWAPPPTSFIKLNFDGATKGNLGVAGAGGVIRDSGGTILRLYAGSIGNSTNNATEFGALELGLEILHREGMMNAIVEGDSTLVVNIAKKLQYGTKVGKVQRHWRLAHSLQKIREHL
jgi:hypothetical protein